MIIRRTILATGAAALVLAGCAGTADDATPADAAAAASAEDDTANEADDAVHDTDEDDGHTDEDDGHTDEDDGHTDDDGDAHEAEEGGEVAADGDVDRVVEIDMQDIAFSTDELEFRVGERVKFVFDNVGEAPHEALIGDMHLQEEHETEMAEGAGHGDGGHHGEMSMISLEPGEAGWFVHEFTEAGELWMGCHVPGHWGAGMQTRITVTG